MAPLRGAGPSAVPALFLAVEQCSSWMQPEQKACCIRSWEDLTVLTEQLRRRIWCEMRLGICTAQHLRGLPGRATWYRCLRLRHPELCTAARFFAWTRPARKQFCTVSWAERMTERVRRQVCI